MAHTRQCGASSRGITLIEMMISLTLTLLIMFAVVQVFDMMGSGLRLGRATIEMAGQLRSASQRLQQDLDSLTALSLPWADPDAGMGYTEVIERPGNDQDPDADGAMGLTIDYDANGQPDDLNGDGQPDADTSFGDIDDVLMFTIRSQGEPLVGRIQGMLTRRPDGMLLLNPLPNQQTAIESQVAEVIWWVGYDDTNGDGRRNPAEPWMLYRRQLLVRPDLDLRAVTANEIEFLNANDISVRPNPTGQGLVANSLSDLTKRENRYAHLRDTIAAPGRFFPYPVNPQWLVAKRGQFLGEDVILGDVLAFDVRVYDPQAPLDISGVTVAAALAPGDPGYYRLFTSPSSAQARGAYVDLNYARFWPDNLFPGGLRSSLSLFSGPPHPKSRLFQLPNGTPVSVYDTWPLHYERDGIDQDHGGQELVDQGTNGLDDDGDNGVDDVAERETAAPYGVPLRGLQVSIRVMDANTRQVRQVSVVGDFVPE